MSGLCRLGASAGDINTSHASHGHIHGRGSAKSSIFSSTRRKCSPAWFAQGLLREKGMNLPGGRNVTGIECRLSLDRESQLDVFGFVCMLWQASKNFDLHLGKNKLFASATPEPCSHQNVLQQLHIQLEHVLPQGTLLVLKSRNCRLDVHL